MLIIPESPQNWKEHISLGANSEAWTTFVIRPLGEEFQLSLHKVIEFDGKTQSNKYFPIAPFNTHEECEALFQEIIAALENGDKVFRVRDYLEKTALQNADIPVIE